MSLILFAQIAVMGIACAMAVLHIVLSFRHEARILHRTFAIFSLGIAGESAAAAWRYRASTAVELVSASRVHLTFQLLFLVSLLWFITFYTNRERKAFLKAVTAAVAVLAIVNLAAPFGILFQELPSLGTVRLKWGEPITVPTGRRGPLLLLMNVVVFPAVCYLVLSCFRLWKQGDFRKAKTLALGLAPFLAIAYPYGLMINWGLLSPPYLYSYAYLALAMLMSFNLIGEAVQTVSLSRKVAASEHRWRTLLENVNLMVAGVDRDGLFNYLNPHFLSATGYSREELLGRGFQTILPEAAVLQAAGMYSGVLEGTERRLEPHATQGILRKDGVIRTIHWSNVPILDEKGAINGVLGIGFDTTDREQAEAARDKAMRELEEVRHRLEAENLYLKEEVFAGTDASGLVGHSPSVRYVLHKIQEVAGTDATVLIQGETGVGKDLVARALHQRSARAAGPYIRVNCAALSPTLIESELFGHERGAFTGADKVRKGRFELADGGTLLLDEVGELPFDAQVKLLRVLQEGEYERVGGSETRKVDVRIIAATNRELTKEVSAGRFREDLFYRLQVYPITVPPLRDRREDIPLLVEHFTRRFATQHRKPIREVPGQVMKLLTEWDWPGNVRELENVVERAVISSPGHTLLLPRDFGFASGRVLSPSMEPMISLEESEQNHIRRALEQAHGKISGRGGAAELLRIHPNTLRTKMEKLGISRFPSSASGAD